MLLFLIGSLFGFFAFFAIKLFFDNRNEIFQIYPQQKKNGYSILPTDQTEKIYYLVVLSAFILVSSFFILEWTLQSRNLSLLDAFDNLGKSWIDIKTTIASKYFRAGFFFILLIAVVYLFRGIITPFLKDHYRLVVLTLGAFLFFSLLVQALLSLSGYFLSDLLTAPSPVLRHLFIIMNSQIFSAALFGIVFGISCAYWYSYGGKQTTWYWMVGLSSLAFLGAVLPYLSKSSYVKSLKAGGIEVVFDTVSDLTSTQRIVTRERRDWRSQIDSDIYLNHFLSDKALERDQEYFTFVAENDVSEQVFGMEKSKFSTFNTTHRGIVENFTDLFLPIYECMLKARERGIYHQETRSIVSPAIYSLGANLTNSEESLDPKQKIKTYKETLVEDVFRSLRRFNEIGIECDHHIVSLLPPEDEGLNPERFSNKIDRYQRFFMENLLEPHVDIEKSPYTYIVSAYFFIYPRRFENALKILKASVSENDQGPKCEICLSYPTIYHDIGYLNYYESNNTEASIAEVVIAFENSLNILNRFVQVLEYVYELKANRPISRDLKDLDPKELRDISGFKDRWDSARITVTGRLAYFLAVANVQKRTAFSFARKYLDEDNTNPDALNTFGFVVMSFAAKSNDPRDIRRSEVELAKEHFLEAARRAKQKGQLNRLDEFETNLNTAKLMLEQIRRLD